MGGENTCGRPVNVTLINRRNYHTFFPLLYQVGAAELEPEDIAQPLRKIFRKRSNVYFYLGEIQEIDISAKAVRTSDHEFCYDYLVVSLGSQPNFYGIPSAVEHAFTLKSLEQGVALRDLTITVGDDVAFGHSLNRISGTLKSGNKTETLLQASPLPSPRSLLTPLINDLTAIPEKFILVLDDYHTIETETIDQALDFFIEHLPPHMHLVIAGRVDSNLSVSRLHANRQLNELRSADLRFTPSESAQFLQQMTELSLTEAEVAALDRRTEGWIAGLQMAVLSLRQRKVADAAQYASFLMMKPTRRALGCLRAYSIDLCKLYLKIARFSPEQMINYHRALYNPCKHVYAATICQASYPVFTCLSGPTAALG